MGISTVSGPFRSKNGFQQLDENGQWVPVTGGGGGGVTSIIAGSGISVSSPTGAVTISATGGGGGGGSATLMQWGDFLALPVPTAIGEVYNINIAYSFNQTSGIPPVTIELPPIGNGFDSIGLMTLYYSDPVNSPTLNVGIDSSYPQIVLDPNTVLGFGNVQIVYVGPVTVTGETYNVFQGFINLLASNGG